MAPQLGSSRGEPELNLLETIARKTSSHLPQKWSNAYNRNPMVEPHHSLGLVGAGKSPSEEVAATPYTSLVVSIESTGAGGGVYVIGWHDQVGKTKVCR